MCFFLFTIESLRGLVSQRQVDSKTASLSQPALYLDSSAVVFDNAVTERKAEPQSGSLRASWFIID
jgi:hypothetical protein